LSEYWSALIGVQPTGFLTIVKVKLQTPTSQRSDRYAFMMSHFFFVDDHLY